MTEPVAKTDSLEQRVCFPKRLIRRCSPNKKWHSDILLSTELRQKMMKLEYEADEAVAETYELSFGRLENVPSIIEYFARSRT